MDSATQTMRPGLRLGVPFDMVDDSAVSALSQLLDRCRDAARAEVAEEAAAGAGAAGREDAGS